MDSCKLPMKLGPRMVRYHGQRKKNVVFTERHRLAGKIKPMVREKRWSLQNAEILYAFGNIRCTGEFKAEFYQKLRKGAKNCEKMFLFIELYTGRKTISGPEPEFL
jgi:hypothetical protein